MTILSGNHQIKHFDILLLGESKYGNIQGLTKIWADAEWQI